MTTTNRNTNTNTNTNASNAAAQAASNASNAAVPRKPIDQWAAFPPLCNPATALPVASPVKVDVTLSATALEPAFAVVRQLRAIDTAIKWCKAVQWDPAALSGTVTIGDGEGGTIVANWPLTGELTGERVAALRNARQSIKAQLTADAFSLRGLTRDAAAAIVAGTTPADRRLAAILAVTSDDGDKYGRQGVGLAIKAAAAFDARDAARNADAALAAAKAAAKAVHHNARNATRI